MTAMMLQLSIRSDGGSTKTMAATMLQIDNTRFRINEDNDGHDITVIDKTRERQIMSATILQLSIRPERGR